MMDVGTLLFNLFAGPVKILLEVVISGTNRYFPGKTPVLVLMLTLALFLLTAPLYVYARRIWRKKKDEISPDPGTAPSSKVQAGGLIRLWPFLLEIPILIALLRFSSRLELFSVPLGPFQSLNEPDRFLRLGNHGVNVIPALAGLFFLLAGLVSARRAPLSVKIGIVFATACFGLFLYRAPVFIPLCWGAARFLSLIVNLLLMGDRKKKRILKNSAWLRKKPSTVSFLLSAGLFSVLMGLLIPSSALVSSPAEFLKSIASLNPLWYILSAFLLAGGTAFLWFGALYFLSRRRTKKVLEVLFWIACGVLLINYLFFRKNLGIISSSLQYETKPVFSRKIMALNLLVLSASAVILAFVMIREEILARVVSIALIISLGGMAVRNIWVSSSEIRTATLQMEKNEENHFQIRLSRTGKNVVVMMLDRAIGVFLSSVFYEKPELKEQFSGFTYYPNTLSHGPFTNFGTPGLFGGYEYTPAEMNKRDQEPLVVKHNEALKMMPTLFSQNGYSVTVCNPSYAGYKYKPDLSIYDGMPNVSAYVTDGLYVSEAQLKAERETGFRNFFCFSVSESVPLVLSDFFYDGGNYHQLDVEKGTQTQKGVSTATGIDETFIDEYAVLQHLKDLTEVSEEGDTFLMMVNKITHYPMLLDTPDYVPVLNVDNKEYDRAHADRFTNVSFPLKVTRYKQMSHYHVLMAALIQVGEWLDLLRAEGVYDNTRIILVSDHGKGMGFPDMQTETGQDLIHHNPILMVKDFGATGELAEDDTFMTNADTPTLATSGLIENPVNPFTGLPINGDINKQEPQLVTTSHTWRVSRNNGNTFSPGHWYSVKDNVFDLSNWEYIGKQ